MNKILHKKIYISLVFLFFISAISYSQTELKIDSKLLVSLKEARNVFDKIGAQLYPGWEFKKLPVLFYKPKVQELLINFPYKPKGFSVYTGFNPLGDETIYYRNDTTFFSIDDQNTSFKIDSTSVLVVADPFSSMRNQIHYAVSSMPKDTVLKWIDEWGFVPSAYDILLTILHEGFHVYQENKAPNKYANEISVIKYPTLSPFNNSMYVLEGKLLSEAMLTEDINRKKELASMFIAVRNSRLQKLDSVFTEYENLNEYVEGTAKYVEYKFLSLGKNLMPVNEMYYLYNFNGYKKELRNIFVKRLDNMMKIISVSDNRFGNKYGTGPVRFRLYESGAAIAYLLDDIYPQWKNEIFKDNIYLFDLLKKAIKFTPEKEIELLEQTKREYNYEQAYGDKLEFEKQGQDYKQSKLNEILKTEKTLVTISYDGFSERAGVVRYTPFGILAIDDKTNLFDLVPIEVLFKENVTLDMRKALPVIVDKLNKRVVFAVSLLPDDIMLNTNSEIENIEFMLKGAKLKMEKTGNKVNISFEQ